MNDTHSEQHTFRERNTFPEQHTYFDQHRGRKQQENAGFVCEWCGIDVAPLTNGSYRNHCPVCLHSKHVDERLGDRRNVCRGLMQPIGFAYRRKKGYQIVHECTRCGTVKRNKVAVETVQPDDLVTWLRAKNAGEMVPSRRARRGR